MSIRTLFNIILKIIGLLFIREVIGVVVQIISSFAFMQENGANQFVSTIVFCMFLLLIYCLVVYCFVFRSDWIIDQLKLDKGFADQDISLNVHRSTVLSIAVIVIGGLLVVEELPGLCRNLLAYWQERRETFGLKTSSSVYVISSGVKILIGVFLMAGQRQIVNWIESKRKK